MSTHDNDKAPVALVTGATGGIGRAIVQCLGQRGWRVIGTDLRTPDAQAPLDGTFIAMDVGDTASVDAAMRDAIATHGRLDALVNCAGISRHQSVEELADDTWQSIMQVHVGGLLRCCRAALPALRTSGRGAVVNFSSVGAHLGRPRRAPYAAAKAGIEGMTRTLAVEWAGYGIRVNAVAPGWIETPMMQKVVTSGLSTEGELLRHIPLARFGAAREIATVVAFLLSEDASYVTGQTLVIDGGATISGDW